MEESKFEVRKAIICFQYVERIKSELIIAAKLLGETSELGGDELGGAKKIMSSFLEALLGEIRLAHNVLGLQNFEDASMRVEEAMKRMNSYEYLEATKRLSEAISFVTTSGQYAMQTLKDKGLL